jgi:hypothetical protein
MIHQLGTIFFILLSLFSLSLSGGRSMAMDIVPNDPNEEFFIDVITDLDRERAAFYYCHYAVIDLEECEPVGDPQGYSFEELKVQRLQEWGQMVGAGVADVGLVFVAVKGSVFIGGAGATAAGLEAGGVLSVSIVAGLLGGVGSITIPRWIRVLDPRKHYREARVIREDVIMDREVKVDRSIEKIREQLLAALHGIRPIPGYEPNRFNVMDRIGRGVQEFFYKDDQSNRPIP